MEIEVSLPLDSDGYLRRQCPQCEREFKWHHGPIEGTPPEPPDPEEYFCPYCGQSAPTDQWWTPEQLEALQAAALHAALPQVQRELEDSLRPLNQSGLIKTSMERDPQNPPPPLFEDDDMIAVAPPCHPYEPIKLIEGWSDPLHCLVCGSAFTL